MNVKIRLNNREVNFDLVENIPFEEFVKSSSPLDKIYEPEVVHVMMRMIKPGDHVIDAGADQGYFSMLMSCLVGPNGQVTAFEAHPDSYEHVISNVRLNNFQNVKVFNQTLWSQKIATRFNLLEVRSYSSFIPYANPGSRWLDVETEALDVMVGDEPISFMKIDCEGAEEGILHGAEKILMRGVDCVIAEFNWTTMPFFKSTEKSIRDYMHSLGYDFFVIWSNGFMPTYMPPSVRLERNDDIIHINGMFSTMEKVAKHWPVVHIG